MVKLEGVGGRQRGFGGGRRGQREGGKMAGSGRTRGRQGEEAARWRKGGEGGGMAIVAEENGRRGRRLYNPSFLFYFKQSLVP